MHLRALNFGVGDYLLLQLQLLLLGQMLLLTLQGIAMRHERHVGMGRPTLNPAYTSERSAINS